MRYETKQALIADIEAEHDALCAKLAEVPRGRAREAGVWGDGWTVADLVAHLAEWQFLFLKWYEDGRKGEVPAVPAPGYKWKDLARLNHDIWLKHRSRSLTAVRADFDAGYDRILGIVRPLSEKELLQPGHFAWTGTHGLTTYLAGSTSGHYRFALKVLKRWLGGKTRSPRAAASGPRARAVSGARRQPAGGRD